MRTPRKITLTLAQLVFIHEYVCRGGRHGAATEAAQLAGYSMQSAAQRGYELLQHADVRRAIDTLLPGWLTREALLNSIDA